MIVSRPEAGGPEDHEGARNFLLMIGSRRRRSHLCSAFSARIAGQTSTWAMGATANGTVRQSRPNGAIVLAIDSAGNVAIRSEPASTGATTEKLGTQPAIERDRPAVL